MEQQNQNIADGSFEAVQEKAFDYSFVSTIARVAVYDDLRSAPRVLQVAPAETSQYINALANLIYEQSHAMGGSLPYVVIREVTENFIHAQFKEIIVSILDQGNTVRFADQGPGISFKEKVQQPGFTSAVEPMKQYIRGVGSGLPIVKEYLEFSHGHLSIEDNLGQGSVVTLTIGEDSSQSSSMALRHEMPSTSPEMPLDPSPQRMEASQAVVLPAQQQIVPQPYGSPSPAGTFAPPYYPNQAPTMYGIPQTGVCPYASPVPPSSPSLSDREILILQILRDQGESGVTQIASATGLASSSTHNILKKLEEAELIETTPNSKRRAITYRGLASLQAAGF